MTVITGDKKADSDETPEHSVEVEEVTEKTDLTPSDGDSGCDSDVSVISLGSESSDDGDPSASHEGHSCVYCDRVFGTGDQLAAHSSVHAVTAPSPLVTGIEDSIYERILVEEEKQDQMEEDVSSSVCDPNTSALSDAILDKYERIMVEDEKQDRMEEDVSTERKSSSVCDPNTSALSDSILDNYDSLIENLISSVSPDELLEKIVITQEIPDAFEEKSLHEAEKSQTLETTTLHPLENPCTPQENDVKTISILSSSNRVKTQSRVPNDTKVKYTSQDKGPKVIPIKRKMPAQEKGHDSSTRKSKLAKKGHELEDIEFANFVNEKTFKILSQREESTSAEIVLGASSSSDKVEGQYDSNRWLPAHNDEGPCKVPPPSQKRLKKFLASEKMNIERYYKVRDKCAESEESLREQKKVKRSKRGRLGWMVMMETKNFSCPRKARGWRWEQEETDEEGKKPETEDFQESQSGQASSVIGGSIGQQAQDIRDQEKENVSEDEDDPDEMDLNEDDRASKLLDSLLLDGDIVSETRPNSEDITSPAPASSQSIGANVSMPVLEF